MMRLRQLRWLLLFFWVPICGKTFECETSSGNSSQNPSGIQEPATEEEALFLRRISEFWQEGEFSIAKSQIEEFLSKYPQSAFSDALCSALGDLYLREKNFTQALGYYSRIHSSDYANRVFLNRMQCLYQMQWFATLADEAESILRSDEKLDPEQKLHATYFLAIALYQQCLNASKDPETILKIAQRAEPYFESLFQSELSDEVAQCFAHLCCILKDHPKATRIYEELAQKDPSREEEMLFQAALIRAEYDKDGALQAFDAIAKRGQNRAKEAAYNRLVLTFDAGRHAELAEAKEALFSEMPEEKKGVARLMLGRSLLALKKYPESAEELKAYLSTANESEEMVPAALSSLLEASYLADDLAGIDFGIGKLTHLPAERDEIRSELPKALFSRAQVLKKSQKTEEAMQELERLIGQFPQFNQRAQALFELAHLNYQQRMWASTRNWAQMFVSEFPNHELAPFAWRYLISSSSEAAAAGNGKNEAKKQLVYDLIAALNQKELFSSAERAEWQILYVKTLIEIGSYQDAMAVLQTLLDSNAPDALSAQKGSQEANGWLLLALCYRDGLKNGEQFCEAAEKALEKNADLIDSNQIHILLFNAYLDSYQKKNRPELLDPALLDKSAGHLFAAFEAKAEIQRQNLLWLADYYFNLLSETENDAALAGKIAPLLEHCLRSCPESKPLELEPIACKLAKCYSLLGRVEEQIALLEKLTSQYRADPESRYLFEKEACLLLGEGYAKKGEKEKALHLFNAVVEASSTLRSAAAASACLQSARLTLSDLQQSDTAGHSKAAAQLKNLILQRTLSNEPCHLEAALEYIDLQTRFENPGQEKGQEQNREQKKLSLLQKTKEDFERTDDLLSKDYQEGRKKLSRKNQIYNDYMRWIDAEILLTEAKLLENGSEEQKELQAKAKVLLLQIREGKAHPCLFERAQKALQFDEKPEAKA